GKGGGPGLKSAGAPGGAGGVAGTGDFTPVGNGGDRGGNQSIITVSIPIACGGSGFFGGKPSAGSTNNTTTGANGGNYGAGGNGGVSWNAGGAAAGGNGAQGVVIITEYVAA